MAAMALPAVGVNLAFTGRGRARDARKREPEEQGAFLHRMLRAAAARATQEDPGRGLAMLLEVQRLVDALVAEVGTDLVDQVGQEQVAQALGWTRQRVYARWGTKSGGAS